MLLFHLHPSVLVHMMVKVMLSSVDNETYYFSGLFIDQTYCYDMRLDVEHF